MSEPDVQMTSVSLDAESQAFANELYWQVFVPLLQAYIGSRPDPIDACVGAMSSLLGCIVGSLAAATSPEYASSLLRHAADSCDALPDKAPPEPAAEGARTH